MEQSAYDALFLGIFILIFITATSTTLFLFREIINYSDDVFDASNQFVGTSVFELDGVDILNTNNEIRGSDALAYITNFGFYELNGKDYISSKKYDEDTDLRVKVTLRDINNSITNTIRTDGYYNMIIDSVKLDRTVEVQLKQVR